MYQSRKPHAESVMAAAPQAEQVMGWIAATGEVERTLRASLGELPSQREERLSRMADIVQAAARGLGLRAAAVWAEVPERLLEQWLANDPEFAAAVRAATALAEAHGLQPGESRTPATIRVVAMAVSGGATFKEAAAVAGISAHKLRQLWHTSPVLVALVDEARRVRRHRPRVSLPPVGRSRTPARTSPGGGYRLVRRDGAAGD
ncbi:hypothetical protein [Streptomyces sp. NPDC049916]|uniref:hypothetical protein n=1 Tax=Streptomyces sp. NPDC049916 TaxID=3155156 RepID=UPI003428EA67